jgi:hypothetical protein
MYPIRKCIWHRSLVFVIIFLCTNIRCRAYFVSLPNVCLTGLQHRRSFSINNGHREGIVTSFRSPALKNVDRRRHLQNCKYRDSDSDGDIISAFSDGGGGGGSINRNFSGRGDFSDDGNDGDDDAAEREVYVMLKKLGLTTADIGRKWGEGAQSLSASRLLRFLKSYTNFFNRKLIDAWPAWRDKMIADPNFVYKLLIEQTVGLGLVMSGTIAARGKDLLKELDFFLTDCTVGKQTVRRFLHFWMCCHIVHCISWSVMVRSCPQFHLNMAPRSDGAGLDGLLSPHGQACDAPRKRLRRGPLLGQAAPRRGAVQRRTVRPVRVHGLCGRDFARLHALPAASHH